MKVNKLLDSPFWGWLQDILTERHYNHLRDCDTAAIDDEYSQLLSDIGAIGFFGIISTYWTAINLIPRLRAIEWAWRATPSFNT